MSFFTQMSSRNYPRVEIAEYVPIEIQAPLLKTQCNLQYIILIVDWLIILILVLLLMLICSVEVGQAFFEDWAQI